MIGVWLVRSKNDGKILCAIAHERGQTAEEVLARWHKTWIHDVAQPEPAADYVIEFRMLFHLDKMEAACTMPEDD